MPTKYINEKVTWKEIDVKVHTFRRGMLKAYLQYVRGEKFDDKGNIRPIQKKDSKGNLLQVRYLIDGEKALTQAQFATHYGMAVRTFKRWLSEADLVKHQVHPSREKKEDKREPGGAVDQVEKGNGKAPVTELKVPETMGDLEDQAPQTTFAQLEVLTKAIGQGLKKDMVEAHEVPALLKEVARAEKALANIRAELERIKAAGTKKEKVPA